MDGVGHTNHKARGDAAHTNHETAEWKMPLPAVLFW